MKKFSTKYWTSFSITISVCLFISTIASTILSFFPPLFLLNENQSLYLFSAMAQIIGGTFGLTLTAFVFFVDKFKESSKNDDILYDATNSLLCKYFYILIMIAITCGTSIFLCIIGIIILHNCTIVYPFIVNESIFLFIIGITSILLFGTTLLDPTKLDNEIFNMKKEVEKSYKNSNTTIPGDFRDFLKSYNLLECVIIEFAKKCLESQNTSRNNYRPQIIQSLDVLVHAEIITNLLQNEINDFRMYRNALVHGIDFSIPQDVCHRISEIYDVLRYAFDIYINKGKNSQEWTEAIKKIYDLSKNEICLTT